MILETYLKQHNLNIRQLHLATKIPEATLRNVNRRDLGNWNLRYIDLLAAHLNKKRIDVLEDLEKLEEDIIFKTSNKNLEGKFNLENRRYIGSKSKLTPWILDLIKKHTTGTSFFDVFAGTGIMSKVMLDYSDKIIINDFLYSNEIIYQAFFGTEVIDDKKILKLVDEYQKINYSKIDENYFSKNFGDKFFSNNDAKIIGEIRERIQKNESLLQREKAILLSSLLYSSDKISNTVGHYDAYRKGIEIKDEFKYELIQPLSTANKKIEIYREDANILVKKVVADIAFIDPPYNSRQYSRFYHVLENLVKWEKPKLNGVAMKPENENMSEYCRVAAPIVFDKLIKDLNCNYIVVTYNNTYNSKSNSSKNKITHEEILKSLNSVGETKVFEKSHRHFNAGKSNLNGHKEFVFITKVRKDEKK